MKLFLILALYLFVFKLAVPIARIRFNLCFKEDYFRNIGYINYTELFIPQGSDAKLSTAVFKTNVPKMLHEQGYKIILNIGDQASDFEGGYAEKEDYQIIYIHQLLNFKR